MVIFLVAVVTTILMVVTDNAFITSLAANVWGVVILMIALDITPRDAQEKEEST